MLSSASHRIKVGVCVDAQRDVMVGMSGDPLDDVRWCLELQEQAHHGVAEVM